MGGTAFWHDSGSTQCQVYFPATSIVSNLCVTEEGTSTAMRPRLYRICREGRPAAAGGAAPFGAHAFSRVRSARRSRKARRESEELMRVKQ